MILFAQTVLYFVVYAFLGWVWEFFFNLIVHHKIRLRGFLTMPILPIYGFGALGMIYAVQPYIHNPFLAFMASMAVATILELIVSVVLDKLFKLRLWDYSDWPMNFKGYVCAPAALAFGALGLLLIYVIHPSVEAFVTTIPQTTTIVLAWVLFGLVTIDFLNSLGSLIRLHLDLKKLQGALDDAQGYVDNLVDELRVKKRKFRTGARRWYRYNLRRIRKAYPRARAVSKRPSKKDQSQSHS